jgi:two-component system response regulator
METTNQPKRELILLVEDDPDDELLALRTFRKSQIGVDIVVVRDGEEALDYLFGTGSHAGRDLSVMPTRIMLDLYLPKLSGLEVLQRIKTDPRTKSIPVTMLTGSDYHVVTSETLRKGAEACVIKPMTCEGVRQIATQSPPP